MSTTVIPPAFVRPYPRPVETSAYPARRISARIGPAGISMSDRRAADAASRPRHVSRPGRFSISPLPPPPPLVPSPSTSSAKQKRRASPRLEKRGSHRSFFSRRGNKMSDSGSLPGGGKMKKKRERAKREERQQQFRESLARDCYPRPDEREKTRWHASRREFRASPGVFARIDPRLGRISRTRANYDRRCERRMFPRCKVNVRHPRLISRAEYSGVVTVSSFLELFRRGASLFARLYIRAAARFASRRPAYTDDSERGSDS